MDSFFASIEERDNPRLAGKPIVVGADPFLDHVRGVVSTANYAARKYGIHSALPIGTAWRLAEAARLKGLPTTAFLPVDMEKYSAVSREVMAIVRGHAAVVEEASVDEAYFDLSPLGSYEAAIETAQMIKREIAARERLTASVGLGPNKLIAKIASDREKPNGLTVVHSEEAEAFLSPLPIRTIPGVGPKTEERFRAQGVHTVADAKRFSSDELHAMLGKWGTELFEKLRGRDETPLITEWEAKSVGEQETFMEDTVDPGMLSDRLVALAAGVHARFVQGGFKTFRAIAITVRFADFTTVSRTKTLPAPDGRRETIQFEALRLLMPFLDLRENPKRKPIRLVGVRVEKLV